MRVRSTLVATALGSLALLAVLVGAAVVIFGGNNVSAATGAADPSGYTVLESGPLATDSAAVKGAAQGDELDEFKLDPAAARDLGKLTPDGNWALVPGAEGSCIVSPDGGSGCAARTDFERRGVQLIRAPDALPEKLPKEELAAAKAGRQLTIPRKVSMTGATSIGVAPDGVRTVRIVDEQGEFARAEVKNNAYVIDGAAPKASRLELVAADGSVVTSVPVG